MSITANRLNTWQFEARHFQRYLGVDRNKLFYWSHTHRLFEPDEVADTQGKRSKYSAKNLFEVAIIVEMLKHGFDLKMISCVKQELDKPHEPLDSISIIDYAMTTDYPGECWVSLHGVQKGRVEAVFRYMDANGAVDFDSDGLPYRHPGPAEFSLGRIDGATKRSKYISIRIEIGQLAHDLFERIETD